jgi:4-amino-4-deoxy-L-arabinose transferase-like glycosyltransferase
MSVVAARVALEKSQQDGIRTRAIFALWIASLVLLTLFLGNPPVTRTQEARVLETARQMLGRNAHEWLVPKLNGSLRLQKPPLTYWMSGASFHVGDIDEFWGRLPTAITGWLTLAVVYLGAKWIFGQRAGLISATALLGSYFFYRHSRLAETDAPAMLFVTLAILSAWRAADEARFAKRAAWFHLAAASTGLAIMSKGAPGGFAVLFLVALILVERDWQLAIDFLKSGALITALVIALPWFAYVGTSEGWGTFIAEMKNNAEGGDHGGSFFQYIPELFVGTAPWCVLMPVAIYAAIQQRRDVRFRRMIIWLACIAVPLCLQGNKQKHYLLPLMSPIMMLVGWLIDRAMSRSDRVFGLARTILWFTIPVMAIAAIAVLVASRVINGRIDALDLIVAIALLMFAVLCAWMWQRNMRVGIAALLACATVLMPLVVGLWAPALSKNTARDTAIQLNQTFGVGPYAFVGSEISLPLCWEMRTAIPRYDAEADVLPAAKNNPSLAVISLAKDKRPPMQLSSAFVKKLSLRSEDRILEVYQLAR